MTRPDPGPAFPPLDTLYTGHHQWLRGWLQRRLGNAHEAADLAHDTFLRLLANRRETPLTGHPRAFLTHIAKGLLIDHWRRQEVERAYRETLAHLPEALAPSAEQSAAVLQALHRIDAMLRTMPTQTREIFLLAQIDGLTYNAIAQQQGVALRTVKRHMRAAFLACLEAAP